MKCVRCGIVFLDEDETPETAELFTGICEDCANPADEIHDEVQQIFDGFDQEYDY